MRNMQRGNSGGRFGGGGGRFGGGMDTTAPVQVGDEIGVTIEAVGEKGDGIAKKDGFVIFIAGAKEGQTVRIRITKVLRKVGFGELVDGGAAAAPEAPAEGQAPAEEAAPSAEFSEDFGEEAPAEEPAPEATEEPAEESKEE